MLVNGQFCDSVTLRNRGLAYGDGLFETLRVEQGGLPLLKHHLVRLRAGCKRLAIPFPEAEIESDLALLRPRLPSSAVLKLMLTRGPGGRGYRVAPAAPERLFTLHPLPPAPDLSAGIDAFLCRQRLASQPALAGLKHLNRLEQVLASLEWPDDSFGEGLMLDAAGQVAEGTRSNVFWVREGRCRSPSLRDCGVHGVLRALLLEDPDLAVETGDWPLDDLLAAEEVFFANAVLGVMPLRRLRLAQGWHHFHSGPLTRRAADCFQEALSS